MDAHHLKISLSLRYQFFPPSFGDVIKTQSELQQVIIVSISKAF